MKSAHGCGEKRFPGIEDTLGKEVKVDFTSNGDRARSTLQIVELGVRSVFMDGMED